MQQSTSTQESESKDIFELIGAGSLPESERVELLAEMLVVIQTRAFDRVLETLSEEALTHLHTEVVESEDPAAMDAFLATYAPNYQAIYEEEGKKYRQQLIVKYAA